MNAAEAGATPEVLDLIQQARGRVPIDEFRLLPDCGICMSYVDLPADDVHNRALRMHISQDHGDLLLN